MLSGLQKQEQIHSVADKKPPTVPQVNSTDAPWMEDFDDDITVGSQQSMTHSERYEFVKNRTYSAHKPA